MSSYIVSEQWQLIAAYHPLQYFTAVKEDAFVVKQLLCVSI